MLEKNDVLKISFSKHLMASRYILMYFLIMIAFLYYKGNSIGHYNANLLWGFLPVLIITLPALILHIQYYIEDKGKTVELDSNKEIMIISKNNSSVTLNYNEILSFTLVERNVEGDYKIDWFPWSSYFYYKIKYSDNEVYLITCLMTNKFAFEKVKNEKESSIIPFLSKKPIEVIKVNHRDFKN